MIKINNISKKYTKHEVLRGVDLQVAKGTIQALLGANGAGKTTLIHILAGILKREAGTIIIDGELIKMSSYEYRRKVGYVLDKPIYIEKLSAQEYFAFVGEMYELEKAVYQPRIAELLAFFDLPTDNKKLIEDYSKGMKAKVSLAAALIHSPQYLILDEPFDGLDFVSVQKVGHLLRNMAQKGCTILLTSHQYDIIAELSDQFALLKEGKIVFNVSMPELQNMANEYNNSHDPVKSYLENLMSSNTKQNISFL